MLELSYEGLKKADKKRVDKEADPYGNYENTHLGVARLLIGQMDRFQRFKGRELDSHCPSVDTLNRMYQVFGPLSATLTGGQMSANEIIEVLKAMPYPED